MKIWLNGELVGNGSVDATSAGVALGWGVFTTVGVRDGAALFWERHLARLKRDAGEAQIPLEFDAAVLTAALDEVLQANGVRDGLARLTLTQRSDGRWNSDEGADFSIMALETRFSYSPSRVQISPYRVEAKRPMAGVKTTSYLPYFWAWREARSRGFDEVILREGHDFLAEGARSTLFWSRNGEIWTPSLDSGCLRGIGRELVLEWAKARGFPIHEGQFKAAEVEDADEAWLVSAATGPRSIANWHDETGAMTRMFKNACETVNDLRQWMETVAQETTS